MHSPAQMLESQGIQALDPVPNQGFRFFEFDLKDLRAVIGHSPESWPDTQR
jgi:hypothetical protein